MLDPVSTWIGDHMWAGKPASNVDSAFYPLWDNKMSISHWAE